MTEQLIFMIYVAENYSSIMMLMGNQSQRLIFTQGKINFCRHQLTERLKFGIRKKLVSIILYMAIMVAQLRVFFQPMETTLPREGLIRWLCCGNRTWANLIKKKFPCSIKTKLDLNKNQSMKKKQRLSQKRTLKKKEMFPWKYSKLWIRYHSS